VKLKKRWAILK